MNGFIDVRVEDDGHGFADGAVMSRGLANMRRRAGEFGGRLLVESTKQGTKICLAVPA